MTVLVIGLLDIFQICSTSFKECFEDGLNVLVPFNGEYTAADGEKKKPGQIKECDILVPTKQDSQTPFCLTSSWMPLVAC